VEHHIIERLTDDVSNPQNEMQIIVSGVSVDERFKPISAIYYIMSGTDKWCMLDNRYYNLKSWVNAPGLTLPPRLNPNSSSWRLKNKKKSRRWCNDLEMYEQEDRFREAEIRDVSLLP